MPEYDIVISGAGVAGLTAAAMFGAAGFSVLCVDPTAPVTEPETTGADLRSTAFLQPAQAVLQQAGLWQQLGPHATPLKTMRIAEAAEAGPRIIRDFQSADISELPFGWNLPNWLLRREILTHLGTLPTVQFCPGIGFASLHSREAAARVGLSDGSHVGARLVIAADGRNSPLRQAAGIDVRTTRYGQKALAFAVTHPIPHYNISTEIHQSGGPFTLVPLPDHAGLPSSAVIWMHKGAEVQRLAALDPPAFEAEMSARSCQLLGPLRLASRRTIWPIISQTATRMSAERVALVAEAAHVVPPIGAQGLNMSLGDLKALLDLAKAAPDRLGDRAMLDSYHRRRHGQMRTRVAGIDILNRASMAGAQPLRHARATGIAALHALSPVRKALMQLGLGTRG